MEYRKRPACNRKWQSRRTHGHSDQPDSPESFPLLALVLMTPGGRQGSRCERRHSNGKGRASRKERFHLWPKICQIKSNELFLFLFGNVLFIHHPCVTCTQASAVFQLHYCVTLNKSSVVQNGPRRLLTVELHCFQIPLMIVFKTYLRSYAISLGRPLYFYFPLSPIGVRLVQHYSVLFLHP